MTTSTTTANTATIDQAIITELTVEFDDFRSRIARMSLAASGTLTGMFSPLGPVAEDVIDITTIETAPYELEVIPAVRHGEVLELVAA